MRAWLHRRLFGPEVAAPAHGHAADTRYEAEAGYAAFRRDLAAGMTRMMVVMDGVLPSGNPDLDFLGMMVPHHAGAVEMARLILRHGRDPLVRQMAEAILSAQTVEIASMQARRAALADGPDPDAAYPALSGMRG